MEQLFTKSTSFSKDLKRNITSLRKSEDLFDDLYDNDPHCKEIAIAAEGRVKQDIPLGLINRGFHYTTGIMFPFKSENYQTTRYSDGSFGIWYGSLDMDTTIYETAYHNLKIELNVENIKTIIERQRAVYNIFCQGILIDLREQQEHFPELITEDYTFTHQIGKRINNEGHPGLLAPSARKPDGTNVVVFNPNILSNARVNKYLTYFIDVVNKKVRVEMEPNITYLEIEFNYFN